MSAAHGISPEQAREIIKERMGNQQHPRAYGIGQTMVRLGFLTSDEAEKVEKVRAARGGVFGRTAVDLKFITNEQLEYALGVHLGFLHEVDEPVVIPSMITVARNPYSQQSEEFRSLRTRLTVGADVSNISRLSVTSTGNGAAYAAVNLAASFAQLGRRTLLIDTNLRRPCLARIFSSPPIPGVTDVVTGATGYESAIFETLICNLSLLSAGRPAPDSQRILGDTAFRHLVERAACEFDIVMMLTAPFGMAAECEFVWAVSTGALIVARKDETRLADLENIKQALRRMDIPVAGAAMIS